MEWPHQGAMILQYFDIILHLDKYLKMVIQDYAAWTYAILFIVILLETGLVVTPFLPGDSLLFAVGALAAAGSLKVELLFITLLAAAVLGDTLNYHIGKYLGPKVFKKEGSIFFNKRHLLRAQAFYEKYGNKTIILARFIPVIRTFAPFVAGIGTMSYRRFIGYNILGGVLWTGIFLFGGYYFGTLPFVQANFNLILLGIIFVSFLPLVKEVLAHYFSKTKAVSR